MRKLSSFQTLCDVLALRLSYIVFLVSSKKLTPNFYWIRSVRNAYIHFRLSVKPFSAYVATDKHTDTRYKLITLFVFELKTI